MKFAYAVALFMLPLVAAYHEFFTKFAPANSVRRPKKESIGYPFATDPSKVTYKVYPGLNTDMVDKHVRKLNRLEPAFANLRTLMPIYRELYQSHMAASQGKSPEYSTEEENTMGMGAVLAMCDHMKIYYPDATKVSKGYFEVFKEGTCGTLGRCIIDGEYNYRSETCARLGR